MKSHCSVLAVVRPNHNGENVSLQTFQVGDDVTVKCFLINSSSNSAVWFKQSIGQIPRPIAISYNYWKNAQFVDEFKNGRFNILESEESFHLHITATTKEDIGIYYCGTVYLNLIKFISGEYLTLKGKIDSTCFCLIYFVSEKTILTF